MGLTASRDAGCSQRRPLLRGPLDGERGRSVPVRNYDVFLNHRGPDVKKTLVSHLCNALKKVHFSSFVDEWEILPGDLAKETIKSAIQHSKIHIAIFSPRYAESSWCLDELRLLMECSHKGSTDLFLPIFFNVTSSDLRLLTPSRKSCYNSAFEEHGHKYEATTINNWKKALHEASADIKGYIFPDKFGGDEGQLVESIVSKVIEKLSKKTLLDGPKHPVGVDEKLREALDLMEREKSTRGVRKLGIYGMGGLGKTTLAKSIYNRIHREFESACFMHSVSKGSKDVRMGLKGLQKDMLQQLLSTKEMYVLNTAHGKQMMRNHLMNKRVLIILDDVSEREQLCELMPPHDCHLGEDSQIVITTRDKQVLSWALAQTHLEMEGLSYPLARELFKLHAFDKTLQEEPAGDFKKLANKMADACQGLPLALEVLGSYLQGKDILEWEATMVALEARLHLLDPQREVTDILKISFDALGSEKQKEMFLDIACFLFQEPKDKGMRIWESEYGDEVAQLNLQNLIRKCLVKLDKNGELTMHDLLRDMGRDMADKSHNEYWKRSHLWRENDVNGVLQTKKGKSQVRGLSSNVEKEWEITAFSGMDELKLLVLSNVTLTGDFSEIPQGLRWFQLRNCPLRTPLPLNLDKVAVLDLEGSNLTSFNCAHSTLQNLKELNLSNCSNFKEFPGEFFQSSNSLEILILSGCVNLERMPDSVSELSSSLRYLDISGCSKLTTLPNGITNLKSLTTLLMNNCGGLTNLPDAIGDLKALEKIGLDRVPLSMLPPSFCSLSNLVSLRLDHSSKLRELPSTIGNLTNLTSLNIISCPLISEIPPRVSKLKKLVHLQVSDCESVSELPYCIWDLTQLVELHLHDNVELSFLDSLSDLRNLQILNLQGCSKICQTDCLPSSLTSLDVGGCTSLKNLDTRNCSLTTLPNGIESLPSLQKISLGGLSLSTLPEYFSNLVSLRQIRLSKLSLSKLPEYFSDFSNLVSLDLWHCEELTGLPSTMDNLKKLTSLFITSCQRISEIPCLPATLTSLDMWRCSNLERIPLSSLTNLMSLELRECTQLVGLDGLECLGLLSRLDISGCRGLVDLPSGQLEKLTSLTHLYLAGSGVSVVQDKGSPWIQKMVSLEVVSMMGDEVPDCFKECQRVYFHSYPLFRFLSGDLESHMHMVVPEGDNACRGLLCYFVWTGTAPSFGRILKAQVVSQGGAQKFLQHMSMFDHHFQTQVHMFIYRASHPFVASLKGGDEIRMTINQHEIELTAAVVKLMYGEHEMEETLRNLSLIHKQWYIDDDFFFSKNLHGVVPMGFP